MAGLTSILAARKHEQQLGEPVQEILPVNQQPVPSDDELDVEVEEKEEELEDEAENEERVEEGGE